MDACETGRRADLLQGTFVMLVPQAPRLGPAHGYTKAATHDRRSNAVLQVEQGSLYPSLRRLEDRGLMASFWGTSENNRPARYYRLTPAGRKRRAEDTSRCT